MSRQRKVVITMTYNDLGIIVDTKTEELDLSAQPEIKPIDYQDCANAMLRMWMDKVVTDGEYNRIMDKLNAFWRTRNERSD